MNLISLEHYAKSTLILLFLLMTCLTTHSQVTLKIGEIVEQQGEEVTVYVTAHNFEAMLGMQFSINWNPDILQFIAVDHVNLDDLSAGLFGTPNDIPGTPPGKLTLSWLDIELEGISVPDGTAIFAIIFQRLTPETDFLYFSSSPTLVEFVKEGDLVVKPDLCPLRLGEKMLEGLVYHDLNDNCELDTEETGFAGWTIRANGNEFNYLARTNEEGRYQLPMGNGSYEISIHPPNENWTFCGGPFQVSFSDLIDTISLNIPIQPQYQCPLLEVDVSTNLLRRCFDNPYTVRYCNVGTTMAENASVEVTFDPFLEILESDLPWASQSGTTYTFQLGDVEIGECGTFRVDTRVLCEEVVLGQTHCVTARIFPDTLCVPVNPEWSGANITVSGACDVDTDSVRFIIENAGEGDMPEPAYYIVVEDAVMYTPEPFSLNGGETRAISMRASGATFRLQTDQVFGHPLENQPSISIEGCGAENEDDFSVGFVNQFAQDDKPSFVSIDCRENIGSYDPNEKLAFPKGALEPHYIEPNTDLEYIIRFQNIGTDTAFNVLIRDTLSSLLDITQIRPGASSHPYHMELLNNRELLVFFDQIMLPDSNTNEQASHGFIKFRIPQLANNPLGDIIENRAAIYFDFNEPVATNTSYHTLGENFLEIVSSPTAPKLEVKIDVYPNPFTELAVFKIEGPLLKNSEFLLYRSDGTLLQTTSIENNQWELQADQLQSGWYVYKIIQHNQSISQGKLIKH